MFLIHSEAKTEEEESHDLYTNNSRAGNAVSLGLEIKSNDMYLSIVLQKLQHRNSRVCYVCKL